MKTKLFFTLLSIFCFLNLDIYSQEPCKVLIPEIANNYIGKCKNGLAHGKGVAEGKDKYEGKFKNGLPHGAGIYTWIEEGFVYDGFWKEGKKNGRGKLTYKTNGVDSVKDGIWSNDLFVKSIIPKPYRIIKANSIRRYSVNRIGNGNSVLFNFNLDGKSYSNIMDLLLSSSSGLSYSLDQKQGFEKITFPFTCKVSYKVRGYFPEFEIEIREPGLWVIVLYN